jgi:hypothetical protein
LTFVVIQELDGVDAALYDAMLAQLGWDQRRPDGLVFHAAGAVADGWRSVTAFDSSDAFARIRAEVESAASEVVRRHGRVPSAIRITTFDAHRTLR